MSKVIAGVLTLLVPMFGLFIARAILGDFSSYAWTYIPIFWIPPFSLVPAILMWMGKIGKQEVSQETAPTKEAFHGHARHRIELLR